ncbi:MAG: cell division protein FtsL [Syntrophaceticus schinkii]|jgi:cell division protein FtsB|nr:cell division protein FtsL [Syntrophaceticus schinkii]
MGKLNSVIVKQECNNSVILGHPLPQQIFRLKTKRRSLKIPVMITTAVLLLLFLLLTYIYLHNTATVLSYKVDKSAQSLGVLQRENKSYELEALKLRSLDRVEDTARNKLGMCEPDSVFLDNIILK